METKENDDIRHIFITHDESIFYTNEAIGVPWCEDGFQPLRPESKGKSLHVSGFCCPCHGFIRDDTAESIEIMTPGKNNDGWWTNKDLVDQLSTVMPLFERLHPGCKLVFLSDNSQNHHAKCENGLDAFALNKSDGGVNVEKVTRRDGWWNGAVFAMRDEVTGVQKGVERILRERGCWPTGGMKLDCKGEHNAAGTCCARQKLSLHPDFAGQREMLAAECVQEAGHIIDYYPNFHCELNFY